MAEARRIRQLLPPGHAASRDPQGRPRWAGPLVGRFPAADAPPTGQGVRGVLPPHQSRKKQAGLSGSRAMAGSTRWTSYQKQGTLGLVPHPCVTRVYLLGVGHVQVRRHRLVGAASRRSGVKREDRRWYVILSCDDIPSAPLGYGSRRRHRPGGVVFTTSDSDVPNPGTLPQPRWVPEIEQTRDGVRMASVLLPDGHLLRPTPPICGISGPRLVPGSGRQSSTRRPAHQLSPSKPANCSRLRVRYGTAPDAS